MPPLNWKVMTWSLGAFRRSNLCRMCGLRAGHAQGTSHDAIARDYPPRVSMVEPRELQLGARRDVLVRRLRGTCVHRYPQRHSAPMRVSRREEGLVATEDPSDGAVVVK